MWQKIIDWCIIPQSHPRSVEEDYARAQKASGFWEGDDMEKLYNSAKNLEEEQSRAQHIVNRALAHYCEICDIAFKHTNLTKNHKRIKHKS